MSQAQQSDGNSDGPVSLQSHADGLTDYLTRGAALARNLPIRGPVRYARGGGLHPDIVDAYAETGCYIFKGLVAEEEIQRLKNGIEE